MPGKIISVPQPVHVCSDKPETAEYPLATQWQCDDCGTIWVLVGAQGEDGQGYETWRKLTPTNVGGQDL